MKQKSATKSKFKVFGHNNNKEKQASWWNWRI